MAAFILKELHWLPVFYTVNFKILVLTCRALHGQGPPYIRDLLQPYSATRALRSVEQNLLKVPRTLYQTRGARSFQAVAPRLWNDLPLSLCLVTTVDDFKSQLKTFLFGQAFT